MFQPMRALVALACGLLVMACVAPTGVLAASSPGAVFVATNPDGPNAVVMFNRAADGSLTEVGTFLTGGLGTGPGPAPTLEDPLASQGSLILSQDHRLLFVVNAGSDQISSFRVRHDGLELVDTVDSGGLFPVSLSIYNKVLYVLNAGGEGNITGFRVSTHGALTPLVGSTRSLETGGENPPNIFNSPAQVQFSPRGDMLVVTVKEALVGPGRILVFSINPAGLPSAAPITTPSAGPVPFSFTFDWHGHLLVNEALVSAVSSYALNTDGSLTLLDVSVENFQLGSCWIVASRDYAYTTNTASDTISGYRVNRDGSLSLLDADGVTAITGARPLDLAITRDGRFLYVLEPGTGMISIWQTGRDGSLTELGTAGNFTPLSGTSGIAVSSLRVPPRSPQSIFGPRSFPSVVPW